MKETIDIEALLWRAYAQMRVDKVGGSAAARMIGLPVQRGFAMPSYAERVDTSAPGSRLAAAARHAAGLPDDMLALHDMVLALGDNWFAWEGGELALWDQASAAAAGCEIGRAGAEWWLLRDGRGVVHLEQAGVMALVIQHARDGSRPDVHLDWKPGRGRRAADGLAHDHRGRRRKGEPVSQAEVQLSRAAYHAWRAALALLVAQCEGAMSQYRVTGPVAEAAPWLAVRDAAAESTPERQIDCVE